MSELEDLPVSAKELADFKTWARTVKAETGHRLTRKGALIRAQANVERWLSEQKPKDKTKPTQPSDSEAICWGDFRYFPKTQTVVRDQGNVRIDLVDNEHLILFCLLQTAGQKVPYQEIYGLFPTRSPYQYPSAALIVTRSLGPIRMKIGDINYGPDPVNSGYGQWRYLNAWRESKSNSGLVLLNRQPNEHPILSGQD